MTETLVVNPVPFRHVVVDDWWDNDLLERVADEMPPPDGAGWRRYENGNERKLEGPPVLWGPSTHELFAHIEEQTPELEKAFGIYGLQMETVGGGYHCIPPGGYLQVHTDFNRSPKSGLFRRLNFLIYLNPQWNEPMNGGHLELWDANCVESIAPEFNRTVVFETSDHSWHGHPNPATRWRRSVAAYFFTEEAPPGYSGDHSTVWHAGNAR